MYAKTLLLLVAGAIVWYVTTQASREGMCAKTQELTDTAIKKACEEQGGVFDASNRTCNCPNGTV